MIFSRNNRSSARDNARVYSPSSGRSTRDNNTIVKIGSFALSRSNDPRHAICVSYNSPPYTRSTYLIPPLRFRAIPLLYLSSKFIIGQTPRRKKFDLLVSGERIVRREKRADDDTFEIYSTRASERASETRRGIIRSRRFPSRRPRK